MLQLGLVFQQGIHLTKKIMSDLRTNISPPIQTAFVTGATGFLGSHLVEKLRAQGTRVLALTRSASAAKKAVELGCEPVDRDAFLAYPKRVDLRNCEAVFHLAGLTKTIQMNEFVAVNAGFTADFLKSVWLAGFRGRVIHVSSLAAAGPVSGQTPRTEELSLRPVSHYGRSKLLGERIAQRWSTRLQTTVLRPGAIYGPRDQDFLEVLKTLKWGVSLSIGKEMCVQLTHVSDVVDGCLCAARSTKAAGEAYFVNDPEVWRYDDAMTLMANLLGVRSVRNVRLPVPVAKLLAEGLDVASRLAGKPLSPFTKDKWREVTAGNWIADSSPLAHDCGWQAQMPLERGMAETVAWYKAQGVL